MSVWGKCWVVIHVGGMLGSHLCVGGMLDSHLCEGMLGSHPCGGNVG